MKTIFVMVIGITIGFWIGTANQTAIIADYLKNQRKIQLKLELELAEVDNYIASVVEQPFDILIEEVEKLNTFYYNNVSVGQTHGGREGMSYGIGGGDSTLSLFDEYGVLHDNQSHKDEDIPQ